MSRNDLRTSESEWRGMSSAQRQPKPIKAPKKSIKVMTVLKVIIVAIILMVALTFLYQGQQKCESATAGSNSSILCVD